MGVSQAVRDVLLTFVCMAVVILTGIAMWLADEETVRRLKEKTQ
jgi:hypothetical protein